MFIFGGLMDDEVVGEKVQKSVPPMTTFRENVFIVHTNLIIADIWIPLEEGFTRL